MPPAEEVLNEAVARLEQALAVERRLRDEAEALLAGLRALATAPSLAAIDGELLRCLQPVLGCEAGVVLVLADDGELREQACTDPSLAGLRLRPGQLLRRVLAGQPAALFDLRQVPELAPLAAQTPARSALCVGLVTAARTALLIGVHAQTAAFAPRQNSPSGAAPSLASAALRGLCPRCGERMLFAGLASFAPIMHGGGVAVTAIFPGVGYWWKARASSSVKVFFSVFLPPPFLPPPFLTG